MAAEEKKNFATCRASGVIKSGDAEAVHSNVHESYWRPSSIRSAAVGPCCPNNRTVRAGLASVERLSEREDAVIADEEVYAGLFDPAFGFGGFELESSEGFEWITREADFGVRVAEFLSDVDGACQGAICFFVEPKGDGVDGVGQDGVEGQVELIYAETGFEGEEGG